MEGGFQWVEIKQGRESNRNSSDDDGTKKWQWVWRGGAKAERGLGDDTVMLGVWLEWRRDSDGLKASGLSDQVSGDPIKLERGAAREKLGEIMSRVRWQEGVCAVQVEMSESTAIGVCSLGEKQWLELAGRILGCVWDFLERIWGEEKAQDGMLGITNIKGSTEEAKSSRRRIR